MLAAMVMLVTVAAPALVLGLLYCGWRALRLLTGWRPAAAAELWSDYSELEQSDDRWGWGTRRGWHPFTDGDESRTIESTVAFEDASGERHRAQVRRYVRRGRRPDGAFVIWYDPSDPTRATSFGPLYWLLSAACLACALWTLLDAGMKLAR